MNLPDSYRTRPLEPPNVPAARGRYSPWGHTPQERRIMGIAYDLHACGLSVAQIATRLRSRGFRNREAKPISRAQVRIFLRRAAAI